MYIKYRNLLVLYIFFVYTNKGVKGGGDGELERIVRDLQDQLDNLSKQLTEEIVDIRKDLSRLMQKSEEERYYIAEEEDVQTGDLRRRSSRNLQLVELDARIDRLESKTQCIRYDSNINNLYFQGCNVHVRNDRGTTQSVNGKGNLIIGWNEDNECPGSCRRSGSHNLIVGTSNDWTSWGSAAVGREHYLGSSWTFVTGVRNSARATGASVTGGMSNAVSAPYSSISGGRRNSVLPAGDYGTIGGGLDNVIVSGDYAYIGGGENKRTNSNVSVQSVDGEAGSDVGV